MLILIAALAAIVPAGMFLRWAVTPVLVTFGIAYRFGRTVERLAADPARHCTALSLGYRFGRHDRQRARAGRPGPS